MPDKKTKQQNAGGKKTVRCNISNNSDTSKIIWVFDKPDKNGDFAFDLNKIEDDNNLKKIFEKMMMYSTMTWAEIKKQTHDSSGKSKHHFLDADGMSPSARRRIEVMRFEEYSDSIFSFALENKLRIIGIRENNLFHVIWYDPGHNFYPVKR